ncbi:hypothetical protein POTOM_039880 [Populus tomentosa]|uniref:RING-type domain-containing protein n=1 Tax=Populus tomentosa TaxID=118781 RepID=A0A8X7YTF7_POPTO|nr:hypothetical protein POTOM_039880 [Populus tomentosa]
MTEDLFTSPSRLIILTLVLLSVALTVLLVVMVYGLVSLCWSCLENRLDVLLGQDRHPHDVERGQVTGKEEPATVVFLRFSIIQVDETTEYFSNGCAICLDDFQKGVDCCVLSSCKHVFHSSCLKQWLDLNLTCPICRSYVYDDMLLC